VTCHLCNDTAYIDMQSQYLYAAKQMQADKPENEQANLLSSPGCQLLIHAA